MRDGRRIGCVLVAAGRGERAGLGVNKVLVPIAGSSALCRSMRALSMCKWLDEIVLVARCEDMDEIAAQLKAENIKPARVVPGGDTRMASARNGLMALNGLTDVAIIHDAARPFISQEMLMRVTDDAITYGSGVMALPLTDTIKRLDGAGDSVETLDRDALRAVQTPQAFDYQKILFAHEAAREAGVKATDDARVYEAAYGRAHLTYAPGGEGNMKLTTSADIRRAFKRLMPSPRVGCGYDAHRLAPGRKLILCGVEIPYDKGLLGHSDADVAAHALIDAILGALSLGDIGALFPDSDAAYLGISSIELLKRVGGLARERGFYVHNADITIIAQKPKCAPYRARMIKNIASALRIPETSVSVKATTTEGMGFEGEGLGISAHAVALVAPDELEV